MTPTSVGFDPDKNLSDQLRLVCKFNAFIKDVDDLDGGTFEFDTDEIAELCDLVLALHGSLSAGGKLPTAWRESDIIPWLC